MFETREETASNMTPDSFETADETPSSPDYMIDDLDDLTEEELALWSTSQMESKAIVTEDAIDANWRNSQKEILPDGKVRLPEGKSILGRNAASRLKDGRNGSEPLFNGKENKGKGTSTSTPSTSKLDEADKTLKRPRPESPPPSQDEGLSPGPSKFTRSSQQSIPSSTSSNRLPSTPVKPSPPIQRFQSTPPTPRSPMSSQTRPILPTKLGDLFKKPVGTKVDVLAIVQRCDENTIKRSIGVKRDLHLIDPTTNKSVWLSVWVDAEKFKPPIGSCVLFRWLTLHRFDGRSLNAFSDVGGREWCVVEPGEDQVAGVKELKDWWRNKLVEETMRSFEGDDVDDDDVL
ncbi:hypothetical protein ABW19_dt0205779 [Dactylella cylindrospora]|nr:hypothetical protein ABW19_dt0205779 [Dactylella cylindrospora]